MRTAATAGGRPLLANPALESHDGVVAIETGRPAPKRGDAAVVNRDNRLERFFAGKGIDAMPDRPGNRSV